MLENDVNLNDISAGDSSSHQDNHTHSAQTNPGNRCQIEHNVIMKENVNGNINAENIEETNT